MLGVFYCAGISSLTILTRMNYSKEIEKLLIWLAIVDWRQMYHEHIMPKNALNNARESNFTT
jgi:hypothetical protein